MCTRGEPRNFICLAAVSRGIYQIHRGICQILPRKTVGPKYDMRQYCMIQFYLKQCDMKQYYMTQYSTAMIITQSNIRKQISAPSAPTNSAMICTPTEYCRWKEIGRASCRERV